jgi:hypothetical protein
LAVLGVLAGFRTAPAGDEVETADEQLLREARVGTDGPSLVSFFRRRSLTAADEAGVRQLIGQLGSDRFVERENASRDLIDRGTPALAFLRAAVSDPDKEIARRAQACIAEIETGPGPVVPIAAARLLARREPARAVAVLVAYLPFADDTLVAEEVLGALAGLKAQPGKVDPALAAARTDPAALRRAAAGYVLGRYPEEAQRDMVDPLLADPEPIVRLRAAQGLIAGKEPKAVPVLISLLADAPDPLADQAEELLWRIAGDRGATPSPYASRANGRDAYRAAWAAWWREHGKEVDLGRLEQQPPYLGLTLIAQSNVGKVWEFGKDGKPRWTIEGLQSPIEAMMLSGNRVLVVENGAKRVSERDLRGKILWEYQTPDQALSARRLPNGNTFVASNSSVSEVRRDGKEVYRYRFPAPGAGGGRINSACKLRNGRLLVLTDDGSMAEVDAATGKVLNSRRAPDHACYSIEALPSGGCLIGAYGSGKAVELDAAFKVVWEYSMPGAFHASRLPNGHTLIASHSGKQIVEVTRAGAVVWEKRLDDFVWRAHRR